MDNRYSYFSTRPEVLSVENIAKVRNRLESLGALSPALEICLDHALLKFSREESFLQESARMVIRCEERELEFLSGNGESSIEVFFAQGRACYQVLLPVFSKAVQRSPGGQLLLSLENLDRIGKEIVSWREMTKGLKACLVYGMERFSKEPMFVQKNCWMEIERDGRKLTLISGNGENYIHVFQTTSSQKIQYDIQVATFWDFLVRAFTPTVW